MEADSVGYEERIITEDFISKNYDGSKVPAPHIITVYKNPEALVRKANGYRDLKRYINLAVSDLTHANPEQTPVLKAQLLIANLYLRRINRGLAATYVSAYSLLSQHRKTSRALAAGPFIEQLSEPLPAFSKFTQSERIAYSLQRMNRLTQGVSRNDNREFTWLSPEAAELMKRAQSPEDTNRSIDRGVYATIPPEELEPLRISGETFANWVSLVLRSYGLLSSSDEWNSERKGPAPDNKWQVVPDDKFKSLSVTGSQQTIQVPTTEKPLINGVALINHEVTHVIQHVNRPGITPLKFLNTLVSTMLRNKLKRADCGKNNVLAKL